MLSAVLFRLEQPHKPISTLTGGGVRLMNVDDRHDDRRPDSRPATGTAAAFAAADAAANAAEASANAAGAWVEIPFLTERSTAAQQDGAFGDAHQASQPDARYRYNGIVIEIDVVIGGESRNADEPAAAQNAAGYDAENPAFNAGWSALWMEDPERINAGYALTKLNNRIDRSRKRGRCKDRLRPV